MPRQIVVGRAVVEAGEVMGEACDVLVAPVAELGVDDRAEDGDRLAVRGPASVGEFERAASMTRNARERDLLLERERTAGAALPQA